MIKFKENSDASQIEITNDHMKSLDWLNSFELNTPVTMAKGMVAEWAKELYKYKKRNEDGDDYLIEHAMDRLTYWTQMTIIAEAIQRGEQIKTEKTK